MTAASGQSRVLELLRDLIRCASVTPDDAGCQRLIANRLLPLGFEARWFLCGEVSNVLLTRGQLLRQEDSPSMWFLGHTDVVPPGADELWTHPPFEATVTDGLVFGRGASDMKGAVAAMVVALEAFARQVPDHPGQIGLLLTSDEEGDAIDGIVRVAEVLREEGGAPDFCLVGEPSSKNVLGDSVRIGRRGSIHARLTVHGVQGHTAFPQFLDNPVHRLAPFLEELVSTQWDAGNADFPPTSCQVAWMRAGQGARNVTPANAVLQFNLRHCPESSSSSLRERIEALVKGAGIDDYQLDWQVAGEPFYTPPGRLREAVAASCRELLGVEPDLNTGGGTSDGRFIAPLGSEVVELGMLNATIHQVDEHIPVTDLDRLYAAYYDILRRVIVA